MSRLTPIARKLRRAESDAERLLWERLRSRRLDGLKFRRQVPIAGHIADFCCIDARLIVELDGRQHTEQKQQSGDEARTDVLQSAGFQVIRFWNSDVMTRMPAVLQTILDHVVAATRSRV